MKFGVVVFPGSNCDQDMVYTLQDKMGVTVEKLWHKETDLKGCDFIVLPGGFSYGDFLRSGAIARFSPIMSAVIEHCNKGGYAMGICNGFQILCEAGLLPGALLHNTSHKFICKNQFITPACYNHPLTNQLEQGMAYNIPIAHGEGRFYAPEDMLKSIEDNDQILFKYCNEKGEVTEESNPNGSILNIAGVCNKNKNVMGMMPHPERAAHTELGNLDGALLFNSLLGELIA
ncbi:MAG: phosphoribosylformylglycinamidine synthase I [Luteibaculaceae bacterium]